MARSRLVARTARRSASTGGQPMELEAYEIGGGSGVGR